MIVLRARSRSRAEDLGRIRRERNPKLKAALLGRSSGGQTTKVHLAADRKCHLLAFVPTACQAADSPRFVLVLGRYGCAAPWSSPQRGAVRAVGARPPGYTIATDGNCMAWASRWPPGGSTSWWRSAGSSWASPTKPACSRRSAKPWACAEDLSRECVRGRWRPPRPPPLPRPSAFRRRPRRSCA